MQQSVIQSSGKEQWGQTYECTTQQLHHQGTMHCRALSVGRGSQTYRNASPDAGTAQRMRHESMKGV